MAFLPRLSWGKTKRSSGSSNKKRSSTSSVFSSSTEPPFSSSSSRQSSTKSNTNKSKKTKKSVRFNLWPDIVDIHNYVITDNIHKALWYAKGDLHVIKKENAAHIHRVAMGDLSHCRTTRDVDGDVDCHRGLECHIRDKTQKYPTRDLQYAELVRGLCQLQVRQRQQSKLVRTATLDVCDAEELRRYCMAHTRKNQARAELLATRDALVAMRIYKSSDHWKLSPPSTTSTTEPLPTTTQNKNKTVAAAKTTKNIDLRVERPAGANVPQCTNSSRAA